MKAIEKNGSLDKVLEGTQQILYWKKKLKSPTPHVVWQFLVVKPNEHEIPAIKKLARAYKVDRLVFKTAQIYDYKYGSPLIPDQEQYARYRKNTDGSYSIKNRMLDECWKMWHSAVVTWDGKVLPCCFDKDAHYQLGSVKESSFQEIWNSPAYNQFRQTLIRSRSSIEMCKNCTEGTKVWA